MSDDKIDNVGIDVARKIFGDKLIAASKSEVRAVYCNVYGSVGDVLFDERIVEYEAEVNEP